VKARVGLRAALTVGRVVATPAALATFSQAFMSRCLERHVRGDWGDVGAEDGAANDRAERSGERVLSSYAGEGSGLLWIITEADRSATTLLLPNDY
jgi:hypothetical protein